MVKIGFGGGCHWCTEAVFQALAGVTQVAQGFVSSAPPDEAFSEAVIVTYDPAVIALETLVEVHLRTHASTSRHKLRGKYRSAVYVFDEGSAAAEILERLQSDFDEPLVTRVLPYRAFKPSDARFRNYYAENPARPFCRTYIDPKLDLLRTRFAALVQVPQKV